MGCQFPRAQEKQEVKSESEIDLQKHVVLRSFVFFLYIWINAWSIFLTLWNKYFCTSIFFLSFLLVSTLSHPQLLCLRIYQETKNHWCKPYLCSRFLSSGKGSGGLNLGNFFASRKGYSRKGFDRLSTEGSDQEKDEDEGSESEEEYSAPLPAPTSSSSWKQGFDSDSFPFSTFRVLCI